MKLNRITAVFAAVLTAFIPFSSYGITSSEYLAVYAEEAYDASTLPDWMPTNYEDALDFRNRYGASHIGFGKNIYSEMMKQIQLMRSSHIKTQIKNRLTLM